LVIRRRIRRTFIGPKKFRNRRTVFGKKRLRSLFNPSIRRKPELESNAPPSRFNHQQPYHTGEDQIQSWSAKSAPH